MTGAAGESIRAKQLASVIRREVERVLAKGLNDPRVRGLVTITGVDLTADLKRAEIRVSVLPETHEDLTMHGLRAATRHIRREAMGRVHSKEMPRLTFKLDRGLKRQREVFEALARAREELPADPDDVQGVGPADSTGEGANDVESGPGGDTGRASGGGEA